MVMGQRFQEDTDTGFFARPVEEVAPDLVGCFLFTNFDGKKAGGMIVQTEAYEQNDVFSYCFVGATASSKARSVRMSDKPGVIYLYWNGLPERSGLAINISCDREGFGSALLIRAIEPLDEICAEVMRKNRLYADGASKELHGDNFRAVLANGPGNVGDSLGLDKPEYELSEDGQLTIFRDPFELYHRSNDCSPIAIERHGLNVMHKKFLKNEPLRAGHENAKAHLQRPWRWIHPRKR